MAYAIPDFVRDHEARHARTVEALTAAHARLRDQVIPAVNAALASRHTSPLLLPFRGAILAKAEQLSAGLASAEERIAQLVTWVELPWWLWRNAEEWTHVREELSGMTGDLGVTNREVHVRWQGAAAEAYGLVLPAHVGAATQLASSAGTIGLALAWAGMTVAVFYTALLAIVLQFIAGLVVALATALAVDPLIGLLVAGLMALASLITALAVLIMARTEAIGRLRIWMNQVGSELRDNGNFPNGHWPLARSEWYSDATVTDGDADWSVVR